jgi:hypothetical protein
MFDPWAYYIDALFRPASQSSVSNAQATSGEQNSGSSPEATTMPVPLVDSQAGGMNLGSPPSAGMPHPYPQESRAEVTRILTKGLKDGSVSDSDKAYIAQVVAAHTGLNEQDSAKRVEDTIEKINAVKDQTKQDLEQARKTTMHASLYLALSMLIGAFIASIAGALGGRLRDEYHAEYSTTNIKP